MKNPELHEIRHEIARQTKRFEFSSNFQPRIHPQTFRTFPATQNLAASWSTWLNHAVIAFDIVTKYLHPNIEMCMVELIARWTCVLYSLFIFRLILNR